MYIPRDECGQVQMAPVREKDSRCPRGEIDKAPMGEGPPMREKGSRYVSRRRPFSLIGTSSPICSCPSSLLGYLRCLHNYLLQEL